MHLLSFDRKILAAAVVAAGVGGFHPSANAQVGRFNLPITQGQEDGLRVPGAFSSEAESRGQSLRLDDRAGTDAPTVELITDRYPDGRSRIERQVTLDTEGNYVNHGTWKMLAKDGTPIAEGQFEMGKRVGTWTRWYGRDENGRTDTRLINAAPFNRFKPPFVSQANFVDDKMEGQWLIVDADERQIMQISLESGKRNGTAITWLPNGKIATQASYQHGVPNGETLEFVANPQQNTANPGQRGEVRGDMRVTARYIDGRREIIKTDWHDGMKKVKKSEEMFLAAPTVAQTLDDFWNLSLATYKSEGTELRHGPSKSWFANGKPQHEGMYENDKKQGMFTYWFANGQMYATGEYKNDKAIGSWIWWHQNGLKAAFGEYNDEGYFVGNWRWWGEDGKLTRQKTYDGSERVTSEKMEREIEVGRKPQMGTTIR
jgi:antitoxin component YwqK of YwqJK toxin-antitoxin module